MRVFSSCLCCLLLTGSLAFGQNPRPERYFPLNTPLPSPGRAGDWAGRLGKASPIHFQPVQIQLPGEGKVTWYNLGQETDVILGTAPSMAGLLVGPVYRVKLSEMPDYPGVVLYPSIEMVDRLHPPTGRETEFPVIVPFTAEEIEAAGEGRLVTKVVYLEQPNRASLQTAGRGRAVAPIRVDPKVNPLEAADLQGRPVAIVRLGGRVPDTNRPEPGFYGSGAPILAIKPVAVLEVTEPLATEPGIIVPEAPQTLPAEPEATQPETTEPEANGFEK